MRTVRFHFDFVSPYAYVAWTQIHRVVETRAAVVEPVPTLFAALLNAHGTKGPAEVPAKRVYVFKDASRKAHAAGLPALTPPPTHPFNPLVALRLCTLPQPAEARRRLIDALYAATWAGGGGVESLDNVRALLERLGLDAAALIAAAGAPAAKEALKANTEAAIAAGVFGVPTALVDGEIFWGVDALPHLGDFLDGRDPMAGAALERWAHIVPSATRR
ncbi:MAG TPA: DsbA family protein [Polyangia bacterium]|nr:DsbA family protein [Polyangia bacterium]